jgi:tetratricopeptide (TPR) repeat protein
VQGMRETLRPGFIGILGLLLLLSSCATHSIYYSGLFEGKRFLQSGQYDKALAQFKAAEADRRNGESLAFLATAHYKTGDFQTADAWASLAIDSYGFYALRALGYRALALFRLAKPEATKALEGYLALYRLSFPLTSIEDIGIMMEKTQFDLPKLERLIDEQVQWYEREVEQYLSTGTGFYDRSSGGDLFP